MIRTAYIAAMVESYYGFNAEESLLFAVIMRAVDDSNCGHSATRNGARGWLKSRSYIPYCRALQIPQSVVAGIVKRVVV